MGPGRPECEESRLVGAAALHDSLALFLQTAWLSAARDSGSVGSQGLFTTAIACKRLQVLVLAMKGFSKMIFQRLSEICL